MDEACKMSVTLPNELWLEVLGHLTYRDLKACQRVCKVFEGLVEHSSLDRQLFRPGNLAVVRGDQNTAIQYHPALHGWLPEEGWWTDWDGGSHFGKSTLTVEMFLTLLNCKGMDNRLEARMVARLEALMESSADEELATIPPVRKLVLDFHVENCTHCEECYPVDSDSDSSTDCECCTYSRMVTHRARSGVTVGSILETAIENLTLARLRHRH